MPDDDFLLLEPGDELLLEGGEFFLLEEAWTAGYPIPIVDAGFGGELAAGYLILSDTVRGLLGTGILAPENAGVDLSESVIEFSSKRGRSRPFGPFGAGSSSVLFADQDGNLNPKNLAGIYVAAGVTQVRPMVLVRIRVEYPEGSGTTYPINAVYAEAWDPSYTLAEAFCTMRGADAFKAFALNVPSGPSTATGSGETTGARVGRRLDDHGWSALDRSVDAGQSTLQATTRSGSPLADMQDAEEAEAGYLYMSADNRVIFRDRHSRLADVASRTVQATFGDAAGELHYDWPTFSNDDEQIINEVTATVEGGTPQTFTDAASSGAYFPRPDNVSGLQLETDTDALNWATFRVGRYSEWDGRVESLTFELVPGDYRFSTLLGLDIGYRIAVNRRPADGNTYAYEAFVEQIDWTARRSGWSCTLGLSAAETFTGFILGESLLGSTTDLLVAF